MFLLDPSPLRSFLACIPKGCFYVCKHNGRSLHKNLKTKGPSLPPSFCAHQGAKGCAPYFSCCDKIPTQDKQRRKGFIGLWSIRVQSIVVGKTWRQEHEAPSNVASAVRRERGGGGKVVLSSFFPFNSVQGSSPWVGATSIQIGSSLLR